MKKPELIFKNIFFSTIFLFTSSKEVISQNMGKPIFDNRISASAKGTKIDTLILRASFQRDSIAAEKLMTNYLRGKEEKKQPLKLEQKEISDILILDYLQSELHVQYAESYLTGLKKYQDDGGTNPEMTSENREAIWQELEWFKIKGIQENLKNRITSIYQNLPPRPTKDTAITKEILAAARKTFQSGKAIYIYYPDNKPIEFDPGSSFFNAINAPTTYIRYIRSPQYPPSGCRVVTYMFVSKDGKEAEPKAFNQGYEACILPTGMLKSFYLAVGTPQLQPDTKLFIHVESLFDTKEGKEAVVISNTIAIPVVLKK